MSIENKRKLVQGNPGQHIRDFYANFNWKRKELNLGWPRTEAPWFQFKFEMNICRDWAGPARKELDWFPFGFKLKTKEIGLGTESDWCLFKFQLNMNRTWSRPTQGGIWLISIHNSIENDRNIVENKKNIWLTLCKLQLKTKLKAVACRKQRFWSTQQRWQKRKQNL